MLLNEYKRTIRSDTLRYYMRRHNLTQQALADAVGVTQPAVANWLRGNEASMEFATGMALAAVLGVEPAALVQPPPAQ